jgi:hypothetical protein
MIYFRDALNFLRNTSYLFPKSATVIWWHYVPFFGHFF